MHAGNSKSCLKSNIFFKIRGKQVFCTSRAVTLQAGVLQLLQDVVGGEGL